MKIYFFCDECKKSKTSDNDRIFIKEESENISFKETEDIDIKDEIKEENKNIIFDEEVNFFAEEHVLDIKEEFEHSEFDQVMLMIELNTNMEKEEINEINILNNFFEDEICDDSLYNDCTDNLIN